MRRPVDEDMAIQVVAHECGEFAGLAKRIEEQIKALPSVQQWTPCSEGMPKQFGRYLVTIIPDAGPLWRCVEFAYYSDPAGIVETPIFWQCNVDEACFENVTKKVVAWAESPKAYYGVDMRKETDG